MVGHYRELLLKSRSKTQALYVLNISLFSLLKNEDYASGASKLVSSEFYSERYYTVNHRMFHAESRLRGAVVGASGAMI
jgi:hypothetical protein